jgi:signal transduction histidine kinase
MNTTTTHSQENPATEFPLQDHAKRFRRSLECFLRWGFVARILLAAIAFHYDIRTLSFAFLSGAAIYLVLGLVLKRHDIVKPAIFILGLEWTALCALCFIHFGTDSSFHLIVMLLAFVTINCEMLPAWIRILNVALVVLGGWFIHPLFAAQEPLLALTKSEETLLSIINTTLFCYLVTRILIFFHHTQKNKQIALERLAEARMRLISDLSHEIKTPLAAILTTVQGVLRHEHSTAEYQSALQLCERNTRYLARLSHRMLDLAGIESGRLASEWSTVDPREILVELATAQQPLAEDKGVLLEVDGPVGQVVSTDADKVRIIVGNLLNNAIRYSGQGQSVRMSCGVMDGTGEVFYKVSDSGGGISSEDLPHIFEPFYRADKSRSRKEPVFGLGLAIATAMARSLGGRIEVESGRGKGSEFTVLIPSRMA